MRRLAGLVASPGSLEPSGLSTRHFVVLFLGYVSLDRALARWFAASIADAESDVRVPRDVTVFTMALFLGGTALHLLNASLTMAVNRSRLFQAAAYVNACAAYAHVQMARGADWFVLSNGGAMHSGVRILEWFFSTPVMLMLVLLLYHNAAVVTASAKGKATLNKLRTYRPGGARPSTAGTAGYRPPSIAKLVQADLAMLGFGILGGLTPLPTPLAVTCGVVSATILSYVLYNIARCMLGTAAITRVEGVAPSARHANAVVGFNVVSWFIFPVVFYSQQLGYLDENGMHIGYSIGDVLAKLSLSVVYLAANARVLELADEAVLLHLEGLYTKQQKFFHNISTEMRQPLNTIIGFSTFVLEQKGNLPPEVNDFQKKIIGEAESMRDLINMSEKYADLQRSSSRISLPRQQCKSFTGVNSGGQMHDGLSPSVPNLHFVRQSVFTPVELMDQVMEASRRVLPSGFQLVVDIKPGGIENTKQLEASINNLRNSLVTLVESASAALIDSVDTDEMNRMVKGSNPPCVKVSMELEPSHLSKSWHHGAGEAGGRPKRRSEGNVHSGYETGKDGKVNERDGELIEATFMVYVLGGLSAPAAGRVNGSSDRCEDGGRISPHGSSLAAPEAERAENAPRNSNLRVALNFTVAQAVIDAMGGELTYTEPPEEGILGDVFAFSIPVSCSLTAVSDTDFVDFSMADAKVAAVLHPALSRHICAYYAELLRWCNVNTTLLPATEKELEELLGQFGRDEGVTSSTETEATIPLLIMPVGGVKDAAVPIREAAASGVELVAKAGPLGCAVYVGVEAEVVEQVRTTLDSIHGDAEPQANPRKHRNFAVVSQPTTPTALKLAITSVITHVNRKGMTLERSSRNSMHTEERTLEEVKKLQSDLEKRINGMQESETTISENMNLHAHDAAVGNLMTKRRTSTGRTSIDSALDAEWLKTITQGIQPEISPSDNALGDSAHESSNNSQSEHSLNSEVAKTNREGGTASGVAPDDTGVDAPKPRVNAPLMENELVGMYVLVVDDNHFQLRVVKATLQKSGVTMDVALHGEEAVNAVKRRIESGEPLYDIIFMDSMMPVMCGATATREIRQIEQEYRDGLDEETLMARCPKKMIIVGLSAEAGDDYEKEARDCGMDGTLGKPCRPETMRETLKAVNKGTFRRGCFKQTSKRANLHF